MARTKKDWEFYNGDQFGGFQVRCKINSAYSDITDSTVICQIKQNKTDTESVVSLSSANGDITFPDAANGLLQIEPFNFTYGAGTYYYDVQVTYTSGAVKTFVYGKITNKQDVSV